MADPGDTILFPAGGGRVSPAAVRRFQLVISRFPCYGGYPGHNRPVQPLTGRVISVPGCPTTEQLWE